MNTDKISEREHFEGLQRSLVVVGHSRRRNRIYYHKDDDQKQASEAQICKEDDSCKDSWI